MTAGSDKSANKAAKKAAKAQSKLLKKGGGEAVTRNTVGQAGSADVSPTAAQRSAAAAERQVTLQRYRVLLAAAALAIAVLTLLITMRPWQWIRYEPDRGEQVVPQEEAPR